MFDSMPSAMPFVKAGRLKAIAFTGAARLPAATEVPTLGESGVTDMVVDFTWHGWFLPAKTPNTVARRLHAEARNALQTSQMRALMDAVSFRPVASSPEDFRRYLLSEMKRYAEIVKAARVRLE